MIKNNFVVSKNNKKSLILKVSSRQALENMKRGEWWFRHPSYFNYEELVNNDNQRGDKDDCLISEQICSAFNIDKNIKTSLGTILPGDIPIKCKLYNSQLDINKQRLLCFYSLDIDEYGNINQISEKMKSFGDSFAFVNIDTLQNKIKEQNIYMSHCGDMNYIEDNYNGVLKNSKFASYKYQNEYRITLSEDKYAKMIEDDKIISKLNELLNKAEKRLINEVGIKRANVYNEVKKIEKEILTSKTKYVEKINVNEDLLSNILPIETLFNIKNLSEINNII